MPVIDANAQIAVGGEVITRIGIGSQIIDLLSSSAYALIYNTDSVTWNGGTFPADAITDAGTLIPAGSASTPDSTATLVATDTELSDAYATLSAGSGGAIEIGTGSAVSTISLTGGGASAVTIRSQDTASPHQISAVSLTNVTTLTVEDVNVYGTGFVDGSALVLGSGCDGVTVRRVRIESNGSTYLASGDPTSAYGCHGLMFQQSSNIIVDDCYFTGVYRGARMEKCTNCTLQNNELFQCQSEGIQLESGNGITVADNLMHKFYGADHIVNHCDFVQLYTVDGYQLTTDIHVLRNVLIGNGGGGFQGVFLNNEAFGTFGNTTGIRVEGNLVFTNHTNGIRVRQSDGAIVRDNCALWSEIEWHDNDTGGIGWRSNAPRVQTIDNINDVLSGNISVSTRLNGVETSADNNFSVNYDIAGSALYAYDHFVGLGKTTATTQDDLRLVSGSTLEGFGPASIQPVVGADDTTPVPFDFADQAEATTSTVYTSAWVQITGTSAAASASITGGEYQFADDGAGFNATAWASAAGTHQPGQWARVRGTSSASDDTAVDVALTIGDITGTYTITTAAAAVSTAYTAPFNDDFSTDPTANFTAMGGAAISYDVANAEIDVRYDLSYRHIVHSFVVPADGNYTVAFDVALWTADDAVGDFDFGVGTTDGGTEIGNFPGGARVAHGGSGVRSQTYALLAGTAYYARARNRGSAGDLRLTGISVTAA